jgi:hypothetical protein
VVIYVIFDKALEVCLRVTKDLGQLNLSAEDRAMLAGSHGSSLVINRIRTLEKDILARAEKGKKAKRAADLANGFCEVAARLSPHAAGYDSPNSRICRTFWLLATSFQSKYLVSGHILNCSHFTGGSCNQEREAGNHF